MSSLYSVNYHLRSHKRDAFIDFIKSMLLPAFILSTASPSTKLAKYIEVMVAIQDLIDDHIKHQKPSNKSQRLSRLSQLVPSTGSFFTRLDLQSAFLIQDDRRSMSGRQFVPPSFNDIRYILNSAQIAAIAPNLKLLTFDGDMTLYADGKDFDKDSKIVAQIMAILSKGINVAIVTAAGYSDACGYEKRLNGLLYRFKEALGNVEALNVGTFSNFYVLGGECNFMFRYNPATFRLEAIDKVAFQTAEMRGWDANEIEIGLFLDAAESQLKLTAELMQLDYSSPNSLVRIIRKDRAVGLISNSKDFALTREQLDEFALATKHALNLKHAMMIPFCCFNGGSDVWVDIGNKFIGVLLLCEYLRCKGSETLHVGDQFLGTGNDIATREGCCTVWISEPEETASLLEDLIPILRV